MGTSQPHEPAKLSPFFIALACTILKHKPSGIGAREYVCKLRAQLNKSTGGGAVPYETSAYVNGVTYWKDMFLQSQYEINVLQSRIGELVKGTLPIAKRKATEPNVSKKTARRKTQAKDLFEDNLSELAFPETDELNGNVILSHLHSACQARKEADPRHQHVCAHLVQALIAIGQHLDMLEKTALDAKELGAQEVDLLSHFRAVSRSFGMILSCLSAKHGPSSCSAHQEPDSGVVFNVVELVDRILDRIAHLGVKNYILSLGETGSRSKSKGVRDIERMLSLFIRLVLDLLSLLLPASKAHFEIFEGIMYLVLNRSAKLLYIITFGHPQPIDIDQEIQEDQETFASGENATPEANRAVSEAKYLFMILKRLMAVAPTFYKQAGGNTLGRSQPARAAAAAATAKAGAGQLPLHARQRLQATLVRCIWDDGDEAEAAEFAAEFGEAIRRTAFTGNLPAVPVESGGKENGHAWFVDGLWQLVGWDILGQKTWSEV